MKSEQPSRPPASVEEALDLLEERVQAVETARKATDTARERELTRGNAPAYATVEKRMLRQVDAGISVLATATAILVDPAGNENLEAEHNRAMREGRQRGDVIRELALMILREVDGHRLESGDPAAVPTPDTKPAT